VQKFLAQLPAQFTVAFDSKGTTPQIYGVKGMPTSFLIGRDGRIILQHSGFKESDREPLEQQIKTALEAKK
jgi:cytochrome c biogenesis protein CcmG/thiol:disulfide interchange protein DsbE